MERDQVKKIRDTPFPLPFAQVCSLLLLFWCLTLPVIVAIYVNHTFFGSAISFLGVLSLFSINGISSELECPFDDTPNDLPLEYYCDEFTDSISEMMTWLEKPTEGNIAGVLKSQPSSKPWGLVKVQNDLKLEAGKKKQREMEGADKKAELREKTHMDFDDNPAAHEDLPLNVDTIRMRVTTGRFKAPTTVVNTLDKCVTCDV